MEDKQFNRLFDLITRCVTGIREVQEGQKDLKSDVADSKAMSSNSKKGRKDLKKVKPDSKKNFELQIVY